MSDHTKAIVPIESWSYNSPEIRFQGYEIDIGLLAEALIYYDTVYVNVANQPQFALLIEWFIRQDRFEKFLSLVSEGIIQVYDFSFATAAVRHGSSRTYTLTNIQDEAQRKPNSFEQRFLYHTIVQSVVPNSKKRKKLYSVFRDKVVEGKSNEYSIAIENARLDHADPRRVALILQAFVDELYRFRKLGHPPQIIASVDQSADKSERSISWNIDIEVLSELAGPNLFFRLETPLTAGGVSNRLLWAAAQQNCDLYLGSPMSTLVGDKLYEASYKVLEISKIIETLEKSVEFPDVRGLINTAKMNFDDVLLIRDKAKQFRQWLQVEGERDRDALIAYHNEVANQSGFSQVGRTMLLAFGFLSGAALGSIVEDNISSASGEAVGAAVSKGVSYLFDIISKLQHDWKPVIFGRWMKNRIKKMLDEWEQ